MAHKVGIRINCDGHATDVHVPVGQWLGAVILFDLNSSITGLDQIKKIYYEDQPHRVLAPKQSITAYDEGKVFVVETSKLPVGCSIEEGLKESEVGIPFNFNILTRQGENYGHPTHVEVKSGNKTHHATLSDKGDGKYSVDFTPETEGPLDVSVTYTVKNSIHVPVKQMVPFAPECIAYGPGLKGGEQYKPGVFTIESRNKLGKKIPVGGANFNVKVKDPLGNDLDVKIDDNKDGTYTVTYEGPHAPGEHVVDVKLKDDLIKDAPFHVNIDYSSETANAANSYAEGPGLENNKNSTRMKGPAHFTIHAVDRDGKPKKTGGDTFDVFIEDPHYDLLPVKIHDNNDGTYTVEYTPVESGKHHIDVVLRNKANPLNYEHVKNSPVDVEIKAGTDPSHCTADGPGLKNGILDTFPAHFKIQARDRDGNPIAEGGDPFQVVVVDPDGQQCPVDIKDNKDGTYDVVYQPQRDGPHVVKTTLDDQNIKDSPLTVSIKPGASPEDSFIEACTFLIKTRDRRGDEIKEGGQSIQTVITNSKGTVLETCRTTDRHDGTYFVDYSLPPEAGKYLVHCTVDKKDIKGSPFEQTVGNITHLK